MFCCSCLKPSTVDSFAHPAPHDATASDNNPAQPLLQRSYTQPSGSLTDSPSLPNVRAPVKYPTLVLHGEKKNTAVKRGDNTVIVAPQQSNSSSYSNHTVNEVSVNYSAGPLAGLPTNNQSSPPLRVPQFKPLRSDSSSDSDFDDMADTTEAVDKAVAERAAATKEVLEAKLRSRKADMAERKTRRIELNRMLADPAVDDETKRRLQADFEVRERELLRESRKRMGPTDFEPLVVIGRGAFGEVKLVRHKEDGKIYAMKTMHKTMMILKNQSSHVRAERDALAAAENQWIVNLHFSFQDEDHLYLVMDFCAGGDLMTLLIKEDVLPEAWVKFYAAEAIQALASVHALGYIHRDIKPDNMLLDYRGHLKLTDLGLCKKVDESIDIDIDSVHEVGEATAAAELRGGEEVPTHHDRPAGYVRDRKLAFSTVGTPDYIDYQVLLKKGYSYEADWWALGTVLYECMLGFPPFYGDDPVQTCRKILHYKTTLKFPADRIRKLSAEAVDFLKSLITDADVRLGTKGGVAEIKAHPWFKGFDWEHLAAADAPWVPPNGKQLGALIEKLAALPRDHKDFAPTLRQLTANFDDFTNLAADDPRHAFPGGHAPADAVAGRAVGKRFQSKFVGFTFKRTPDGKTVLGGPVGGEADPAAGAGAIGKR